MTGGPAERSPGRLHAKVAMVVGAGSRSAGIGTGRATAIVFAREGAKVLVVDRDREAAELTCKMIHAEGGEAAPIIADMTDGHAVSAAVDQSVDLWGRIDVLDNNIGVQQFGTIVSTSEDQWASALNVNLTAMFLACKYTIPVMKLAGGGSIINIASVAGIRPRGGNAPYAVAKGAVIPLTKAMAVDHGHDGVRVNCVVPGPLDTPMAEAEGALSDERRANRRSSSPLNIEGTAWDVAFAALYFAADESRYVTGAVLRVDGGVSLRTPSR
jgi:NAD(P)-dependent dehydrogenase (short-subunit alcohol dehydrogenase family)